MTVTLTAAEWDFLLDILAAMESAGEGLYSLADLPALTDKIADQIEAQS